MNNEGFSSHKFFTGLIAAAVVFGSMGFLVEENPCVTNDSSEFFGKYLKTLGAFCGVAATPYLAKRFLGQ